MTFFKRLAVFWLSFFAAFHEVDKVNPKGRFQALHEKQQKKTAKTQPVF
jgi:hypothetical protein